MSTDSRNHYDPDEVIRSTNGRGDAFSEVISHRMSRRDVLRTGFSAGLLMLGGASIAKMIAAPTLSPTGLNFTPISSHTGDSILVSEGYGVQTVVRWGDPMNPDCPEFNQTTQSADQQAQSFGYNSDFVGFMPLPFGSKNSTHGLLAVNFEYVNHEMMFPVTEAKDLTEEQVQICTEAVGFGVIEIKKMGAQWQTIVDSKFNNRWTANSKMRVAGPAAGSDRMKTATHPAGDHCTGTMSNCSAGKTPWGTVLSGEENFQDMFANGSTLMDAKEKRSAKRYGLPGGDSEYRWEQHQSRFNLALHPNEANTFGWVVEIDPYDPTWMPAKRTSLGRIRHEAATTHVTKDGRVVMYSGDDARFEYVYKFVCTRPYDPADRKANRDILDEGVLYVARFNDDGSGVWLPLVYGQGPLNAENGFDNQADVVIDVRIAADLLGATKMDRPEDIEVNPVNEKVYIVCTNNVDRGKEGKSGPDKSNPRSDNKHGHIVELIETGNDHAATTFTWELFLVCGDPADPETYYAGFPKSQVSKISCPDNICFDAKGNLWIATDGQTKTLKLHDGFFAVPTEGPERGKLQQFMAAVPGAEVCGPEFTPDGKTVFLAIQHPGEGSTYDKPSTSWPEKQGIPRPSVIAITKDDGGIIGS